MSKDTTPGAGRTRWRRFALSAVPATGAAIAILAMQAQGALAASFTISGLPATITADKLVGTGFEQWGSLDQANGNLTANPKIYPALPVATTGLKTATLYNLCQSVTINFPIDLPGLGKSVTLVIQAGKDKNHPVTAKDLFIDMTSLSGDAEFTNIEIGNDATTLDKGPAGGGVRLQNMYGQQADKIVVTNLKQTAYATSAGTFTLNGMTLDLKTGTYTCPIP